MKLSTKGRYAVMAMADLAQFGKAGPTTLADIAERQEISLSYLEQLFGKLRRAGLVRSVRGPGGGYRLAFPADGIRISDIIHAVDEPINCNSEEGAGLGASLPIYIADGEYEEDGGVDCHTCGLNTVGADFCKDRCTEGATPVAAASSGASLPMARLTSAQAALSWPKPWTTARGMPWPKGKKCRERWVWAPQ